MANRQADLLRALDFNAVHCGDLIVRRYFELSAKAIRAGHDEADYWRRRCTAELARGRQYRREADTIAILLQRVLDDEDAPKTGDPA